MARSWLSLENSRSELGSQLLRRIEVVFEDQTSDRASTLFAALDAHNGLAVLSEAAVNMMPNSAGQSL